VSYFREFDQLGVQLDALYKDHSHWSQLAELQEPGLDTERRPTSIRETTHSLLLSTTTP